MRSFYGFGATVASCVLQVGAGMASAGITETKPEQAKASLDFAKLEITSDGTSAGTAE